jgi:hypothetical protein
MSNAVIHIVRRRATPTMVSEMLRSLGSYIKLAVDYMPTANRYCWRMAAARKTSGAPIGYPLAKRYNSRR